MKNAIFTPLLLSSLIFSASAAFAADNDLFSGLYSVQMSRQAKPEKFFIKKADGVYSLKMINENSQSSTPFDMEMMPDASLNKIKPGFTAADELQCGVAGIMVLCHVKPQTALNAGQFVARTGYFAIIEGVGAVEVFKLN